MIRPSTLILPLDWFCADPSFGAAAARWVQPEAQRRQILCRPEG